MKSILESVFRKILAVIFFSELGIELLSPSLPSGRIMFLNFCVFKFLNSLAFVLAGFYSFRPRKEWFI